MREIIKQRKSKKQRFEGEIALNRTIDLLARNHKTRVTSFNSILENRNFNKI